MSPQFKLPEQNAIAADALRLVEAGVDHEIVLGVLRKGGLSKIDSMKVLSEAAALPLLEVRKMVDASRAWQHTFERDREFQAKLAEARQALRADEHA